MITLHKRHFISLLTLVLLFLGISLVEAWSGPTAAPPNNNADAPINVGSTDQVKNGGLGVGAFTADVAAIVSGLPRLTFFDLDAAMDASNPTWGIRAQDNGYLRIQTSPDASAFTDRVTIDTSGNITAAGYFHSSDVRLKDGVQTIGGLDLVEKLRGVIFTWKESGAPGIGVVAQEVEQVLPSAVHTDADGMKSVEYDQLIAPLIEAIKEQQIQIDALKAEIEQLKK